MPSKTYKNIGNKTILGHAPGEEFTAELSPEVEATFVGKDGLKVVKKAPKSGK